MKVMRTVSLTGLLIGLSLSALAQGQPPAGIAISWIGWQAVYSQTNAATDSLGPANEVHNEPRPTDPIRDTNLFLVTREGSLPQGPSQTSDIYRYDLSVQLKNVGAVPIRSLAWEYTVLEGRKVRRFHKRSNRAVPAGTEFLLTARYTPQRTFKNPFPRALLSRPQVQLTRIEYADGSVWER